MTRTLPAVLPALVWTLLWCVGCDQLPPETPGAAPPSATGEPAGSGAAAPFSKQRAPFDEQLVHDGPESRIADCRDSKSDPAALSPEQIEAFSWFDRLGFPDLNCRKLVRVATGQWVQRGNHPPENTFQHAFLLGDDGQAFTVLTGDLFIRTYERTGPKKAAHERVGYEPLELRAEAETYLDVLQRLVAGTDEELTEARRNARFGQRLAERSEVFVLARACAGSGHDRLARRLLTVAAKLPERRTGKPPTKSLQQVVADELAHALMWRAVLAFSDRSIPRDKLLAKFDWLVAQFPSSEHRERAQETAAMLRRMVAEDRAHAEQAPATASMTPQQRIAELVFQLRDQNGHQWSQPGWCDVFADERGENSPAHQLVKIGYPAIPQLIEAIEDLRFSRSVGYHRDFYFSHTVLTIGDCAEAVIERIAGRSFYAPATTSSTMSKDQQAKAVRAEVEKWWRAFQSVGEKDMLIKATTAGDDKSPSQAHLLLQRYPDDALGPILEGAKRARNAWVREDLVSTAASIKGDGPVPFLLEELRRGPLLNARIAAAVGLHHRKRPEAVRVMIQQWNRGPPTSTDQDRDVEKLIGFLMHCGDPQAVRALGRGLRRRPIGVRLAAVSAAGEQREFSVFSSGPGMGFGSPGDEPLAPAAEEAIEKLLIDALDDAEERSGMSGSWGGKSFVDPRICDLAGHVLAQRWSNRYTFDLAASLTVRDRQRVELQNVWRRRHGQRPLALPKPPTITPVPEADLRPVLEAIKQARTPAARRRHLAQLESLGLGALARARRFLKTLPATHPARAALATSIGRLAFTVRTVTIDAKSAPPGAALERRLRALEGKVLTVNAVVELLMWFAGHVPAGAAGIKLSADRPGDGTGVIIRVLLVTEKVHQGGSQKGWSTGTHVGLDNESLLGSFGTASREHCLEREAYDDLARALRKALAASPEREFRLRRSLILEQ